MEATIIDVAKRTKVSIGTVSNVIHNKPNVESKTREKVLKSIHELGYVPNESAQNLKKGIRNDLKKRLTNNIGLIVYKGFNRYGFADHTSLVEGLDKEIRNHDNHLYFYYRVDELSENSSLFNKVVNSGNIDGLIVLSSQLEGIYEQVRKRIKNIISIGEPLGKEGDIDCLMFDDYGASYNAVKYLAESGHKRIGSITNLAYYKERQFVSNRQRAFKDAVRDLGLENDETLIEGVLPRDFFDLGAGMTLNKEAGYRLMKNLLIKAKPLPTAVFLENAESCSGVVEAIREAGLRIPDDISVITIGNSNLMGNVEPKITTFMYDVNEASKAVVKKLLERINTPRIKQVKILFPFDLSAGESCRKI
ncbi:MAG: hypothetical protein A3J83_04405 [Elusimicrobia bacterium RIFOXYA2_FULL_40_6]|nr:MAG: hypothetical protein A3J83_04405 [Elusimicrobia bacterium RIFOXYA2_FULL_40_6]